MSPVAAVREPLEDLYLAVYDFVQLWQYEAGALIVALDYQVGSGRLKPARGRLDGLLDLPVVRAIGKVLGLLKP